MKYFYLFPLLLLTIFNLTISQWTQTPPLENTTPNIDYLFSTGKNLFCGIVGGKSYIFNNGENMWIEFEINNSRVDKIFSLNQNEYLAVTPAGNYLSTDLGDTWQYFGPMYLEAPSLSFAIGDTIYCGFLGIETSVDSGKTFQTSTLLPNYEVGSLGNFERYIIIFFLDYQGGGPVSLRYFSTNGGLSWTNITNQVPATSNAILKKDSFLFLGTFGSGIYRSSDNGSSWTPTNNNLTAGISVSSLFLYGGNLIAASDKGVFYSTDNGNNWFDMSYGLNSAGVLNAVSYNGSIFVGVNNGIFQLNGGVWQRNNTGMTIRDPVWALTLTDSSIFAGSDDGIYRSSNNGDVWVKTNFPSLHVSVLQSFNDTVFAGVYEDDSNGQYFGIYRSTDNGLEWENVSTGLLSFFWITSLIKKDGCLVASGLNGIYRSTDGGNSWSEADAGQTVTEVESICSIDNYIIAGVFYGGAFRSSDDGDHWESINNGLTIATQDLVSTAANQNSVFVSGWGIYKSTDDGTTWAYVSTHTPSSLWCYNNYVFAARMDTAGLYVSSDDGSTWNDKSEGLSSDTITSFIGAGDYFFVGTRSGGVWRRNMNEILSVKQKSQLLPRHYRLDQNYPNPFNPTTTIEFDIPILAHTTLTIFDILGKKITQLINGELQPGHYSKVWNATNQSTGVYFCVLQSGNFRETKKIILQK